MQWSCRWHWCLATLFGAGEFLSAQVLLLTLIIGTMSVPLILKWHYPLMFLAWNTTTVVFFLPRAHHSSGCSWLF